MNILHFESVADCIDDARKPFSRKCNAKAYQTKVVAPRKNAVGWYGVDGGLDDITRMVEITGYPEGGAIISTLCDSLVESIPPALGVRRKKRRSDFGDEYDIHAAMRGAHDRAWTSSHRELRHGSGIARIVVDICARASTSADSLRWRGVAGIVLCVMLRKAGYSVEVLAALATRDPFRLGPLLWTCVVSPRGGSVDVDYLAATLALPGFFRTFGFAGVIRAADKARCNVAPSLGFSVPVAEIYAPAGDCIEFLVPDSVLDETAAREWVLNPIALLQGDSA